MKTIKNKTNELKLAGQFQEAQEAPRPRIGDDDGITNGMMNAMIVLFMLLTVVGSITVSAQSIELTENRILLRQAMLDMDRLEYGNAIQKLLQVRQHEEQNANVNYLLGVCYLHGKSVKAPAKAAFYLSRASASVSSDYEKWDLDEINAPPRAMFQLGTAYEHLDEYAKASECYENYLAHLETKDGVERSKMYAMIKQSALECQLAADNLSRAFVPNNLAEND